MNLKGIGALVITVAVVVGFILWIPPLKWFLLAASGVGIMVFFILRAWYAHKPIKETEEDKVRLHLND